MTDSMAIVRPIVFGVFLLSLVIAGFSGFTLTSDESNPTVFIISLVVCALIGVVLFVLKDE